MKTNVLTTILSAGALAAGVSVSTAQQSSPSPNSVISRPAGSDVQNTDPNQETTGGKIKSTVENFLGRFLGHNGSQVSFDQLPQPVQNTVRGQAGTAPIQNVSEVNENGQTSYIVSFNRNGQPVNLQVDSAGQILNPDATTTGFSPPRQPLSAAAPVSLSEVPMVVQNTLRQYSQGAPMQSIEKGTLQGQTVYEAAFPHNGQNVELRVDQNGALVRDASTDQYLASIGMRPGFGMQPGSAIPGQQPGMPMRDWRTAPVRQPLTDWTMVDFQSLPDSVRQTFLRYAGAGAIDNVQRGMLGGQTVYQAQLQPNGQNIALRVTDSGALLDDQINDRFLAQYGNTLTPNSAMGRAPGWQSGGGGSFSQPAPLSAARSISFDQLPLAVQTTISSQTGGAQINRVTEGDVAGQTVYDITYNQGGRWLNMRVANDGSLLDSGTQAFPSQAR